MQTFLPTPDYDESASFLDWRRLGKQRVEALQILRALLCITDGWRDHTATRMWAGYELSLIQYGLAICREWVGRGYEDDCTGQFKYYRSHFPGRSVVDPHWLGDERLHASHRASLMFKDSHYWQFGWREEPMIDYYWPECGV